MDERRRRVVMNEALFRDVNERLAELGESFDVPEFEILCECGNLDCAQRFGIRREEYAELRADPALFALVPGHEDESVELVVARRRAYSVVRKRAGDPATLAAETDPRATR